MILYFIATFGLAYIIGHSTISLPFRRWLGGVPASVENDDGVPTLTPAKAGALGPIGDFLCALIECPACSGFWMGKFAALLGIVAPVTDIANPLGILWPLTLGCATAGSNFGLSRLTRLI